jgi:hypothetical protein
VAVSAAILSCGPSTAPPPDPDRPRHYSPVGALPAAVPVSTFGEDGERVDPIESLQKLLDAGEVTFSHDPLTGYLPSVLAALDIPISSQVLIFSRTSLQTERIAPWVPRAIYFNDDVYVGHISDDIDPMSRRIVEVASVDPDDGGVFYFLPQDPNAKPQFVREGQNCLMCHHSRITMDVPGFMVRSVFTGRMGRPLITVQEAPTTDRTPMEQRFSGWYVTGTHGGPGHGGNVWAPEEAVNVDLSRRARYLDDFDFSAGSNVTDLSKFFDTSIYLSEHSDIVALLVLTHQTRLHNVITVMHETTRQALREQEAVRVTTGTRIAEGELLPITLAKIDNAVDQLVREMLFSGEAPLNGPIVGTSRFAEEFTARGPFDAKGRTLRQFDLQDRLFEYPLSYLIYTDAFDALPDFVKARIYRRLDAVLTGQDESGDFTHIDAATRTAIREILTETKPEFASAVN